MNGCDLLRISLSSVTELPAKMAAKKLDHSLQLIVPLNRVGEEAVVTSSLVVTRLDCFLVTSQRRFEVTRQRDVVVCASAAGGFNRAMHDENRHVELPRTRVWL